MDVKDAQFEGFNGMRRGARSRIRTYHKDATETWLSKVGHHLIGGLLADGGIVRAISRQSLHHCRNWTFHVVYRREYTSKNLAMAHGMGGTPVVELKCLFQGLRFCKSTVCRPREIVTTLNGLITQYYHICSSHSSEYTLTTRLPLD